MILRKTGLVGLQFAVFKVVDINTNGLNGHEWQITQQGTKFDRMLLDYLQAGRAFLSISTKQMHLLQHFIDRLNIVRNISMLYK